MTPCQKLGYKVGDRFDVVERLECGNHKFGDILRFKEDDGTSMPFFYNESRGDALACASVDGIRPLKHEWDGSGLPPVGAVVDYELIKLWPDHCGLPTDGQPATVKAAFKNGNGEDMVAIEFTPCNIFVVLAANCRPFRTERDRAIDAMAKDAEITPTTAAKNLLGSLFDAGYRKP